MSYYATPIVQLRHRLEQRRGCFFRDASIVPRQLTSLAAAGDLLRPVQPLVTNCILYGDTSSSGQPRWKSNHALPLVASDVQAATTGGQGDINADPLSSVAGRPPPPSPAIGLATQNGPPATNGRSRNPPSMGAFEGGPISGTGQNLSAMSGNRSATPAARNQLWTFPSTGATAPRPTPPAARPQDRMPTARFSRAATTPRRAPMPCRSAGLSARTPPAVRSSATSTRRRRASPPRPSLTPSHSPGPRRPAGATYNVQHHAGR